ncbi:protein SCO1/2 [Caldalkalibacillus uzonensis]|uniref:Protein SCO1/2 n=1 Tax=Caldalkalibacillus uzonensis TaxID=353224 RepID=A0ABU0CVX7_9BACI|nr:SCO family protein [Caldalkalibacillus uzonensis]MDQ0339994.1 protein SCO1/2 [Caldalkalibacillus uzonensis]
MLKNNKMKMLLLTIIAVSVIALSALIYINRANTHTLDVFDSIEPFSLESTTGETYHSDNGKIKLISFILINCPDGVCPMTMWDFSLLQDELKQKGWFGEEVELLAITFDPARDDLNALKEYSQYFNADPRGWHFLRGEEEEIAAIADQLRYVYAVRKDGSAMHATTMYLLDGEHRIRAYHKMTTPTDEMDKESVLRDIESLIKER